MKLQLKIFLFFWVFGISALYAQDIPDPMSPPRLVNDFAGIFSESEKAQLEQTLRNYNDTTSTQIYVVTVNDLQGYDANTYATELGEKWGVGQKGKDNGAVILIKPKIGNSRGQAYIAVGYGLEEKLTDSRIGRILDQYMIPYFMQNDYYGGVNASIQVIIEVLAGQFRPDMEDDVDAGDIIFSFIILIVIFFIVYRSAKNNKRGPGSRGGGFFPPITGGGSGRSSGGFGGGFSGGGGGSFGGGGAGRSW